MTGSQSFLVYRLLVREHFVTILFICLVQFGANQLREGGLDFQHKLFKNYNPPYSSRPPATCCQQHDVEVLIVLNQRSPNTLLVLKSALISPLWFQNSPMFPSMEIFLCLREKLSLSCGLADRRNGLFGGVAMFKTISSRLFILTGRQTQVVLLLLFVCLYSLLSCRLTELPGRPASCLLKIESRARMMFSFRGRD